MEKREFIPQVSIGPLKFGMSIDEVEGLLGEGKKIKKGGDGTYEYDNPFMHIYYDKDNKLEFIEMFGNIEKFSSIEIIYRDIKLFPGKFWEVLTDLRYRGYYPVFNDAGCQYDKLGLGFFADDRTENHIEAIDFFQEGYYEKNLNI